MAYSFVIYTGNGVTTQFSVPFGYVRKEHVAVQVNDVNTAFTWVNDTTVQVTPAPANGTEVLVRRTTPVASRLVDYTDGSTLVAADLDTDSLQHLYTEQELTDTVGNLEAFRGLYYGAYAADPALDPFGGAPSEGDLYFNTVTDLMRVYSNSVWKNVTSDASLLRWVKTAAGGETSLSGNDGGGQPLFYTPGLELLYLNGALLQRGVDYIATNGTTITGLAALTNGDLVEVLAFTPLYAGTLASTSSAGLVQLSNSITSTSETLAATPKAVKDAKDDAINTPVTTARLSDGAVITAKIADDAITAAKLANASVGTSELIDANVTAGKLASDAVTTAKIADANVTTAKVADGAITTAKVADGAITAAKLEAGSPAWDASGNLSFNSGYGSNATAFGCRAWVNFDSDTSSNINNVNYSRTLTTVTVTANGHGLTVGNYIEVSVDTGSLSSSYYTIATVPDANTFTFTSGTSGSTSGTLDVIRQQIRGNGNVAVVTKMGTGTYRVSFKTPMPDGNYAIIGNCDDPTTSGGGTIVQVASTTTGYFEIELYQGANNAPIDGSDIVCCAVFR